MKPPMPRCRPNTESRVDNIALYGSEPVRSKLREVPTHLLRSTQDHVRESNVLNLERTPNLPPITVVRLGRFYYIVEGHHRATVEIRSNAPSMLAWVLTPVRKR